MIIDSSNSIKPNDYAEARSFLQSLARRLQISEAGSHMALILYSWEAHTYHRLVVFSMLYPFDVTMYCYLILLRKIGCSRKRNELTWNRSNINHLIKSHALNKRSDFSSSLATI